MEGLEKLEQLQSNIHLLHSVGVSDANPDAERFLADFTSFLVIQFHNFIHRCYSISQFCLFNCLQHVSISILFVIVVSVMSFDFRLRRRCNTVNASDLSLQITDLLVLDAMQRYEKDLHCDDDKRNMDPVPSLPYGVPVIGVDAMIRSNSTLEDFCRSYFVFHKMEANQPQSIFKNLPMLSFTESYIYQLDDLNEKLVQIPMGEDPTPTGFEDDEPNPCANSVHAFEKNPFQPLFSVLERYGLLTERKSLKYYFAIYIRIQEELRYGEEYWHLERKLCCAVARNKEISIEDVTRAIHLKSFDYRVLNLLLYQLRGEKVNELHMEFLSISELLVEVSDDLFDYEDDVAENSFNILRMFVNCYGASTAPIVLAKFISEAEEKYDLLFKALDEELSVKYRERCEEATREGSVGRHLALLSEHGTFHQLLKMKQNTGDGSFHLKLHEWRIRYS
ncbi:hypothetical protein SASPL_143669 [Salvia splendens]|uniref:Uncharacterized protein n=1 Tax=Salvia splendens TaxID=180675 RepID=A0A8X8WPB2_SALSN|nr:hypothetical protein SASPL_143669 [Salvia splendens]